MTRKVVIDLVDAIGTFVSKTNKLSDYLGDLDDLNDSAFDNIDSNLVSAMNGLNEKYDSISNRLFGNPPGNLIVTGLTGDSAVFNRLRVGKLTSDSATIDSATIRNLHVTGSFYADSARFDQIHVDSIAVGPGASLTIDSATINSANITQLTIDSATVKRLKTGFADIDSATIDSATITNLEVTKLTMEGIELDNIKRFTVKNEGGTIVLDGYFLSTEDSAARA